MKKLILLFALFIAALNLRAQTISNFTPANGAVGTLVTVTGANLNNPTSFTIGGVSAIVVSNTSSSLVALVMPGTTTGLVSINTGNGIVNSASNFTITQTQYPLFQQGNKLVGTDNIGNAQQGNAVSVSADGNTAIVGGSFDNSQQGAAWIYTRIGNTWTQQGNKLIGTGNIGAARQGTSVSISADGNTAMMGGILDNTNKGAVWIFTRTGNTWSQQGNKLVGTDAIGSAKQGQSVSISADGNTAIWGGNDDNGQQGAVWVYTRTGNTWSQQGNKLVASGNVGAAQLGWSVSLSADGNTFIVGGNTDNSQQGAAWVFTRSGNTWTQQGNKLVASDNVDAAVQGQSVSISADGNTAIVGGIYDNSQIGAAWVYTRTGNTWTQQGSKLVGTGNMGITRQGYSVALSADGNTAMVGGNRDNSFQGAAWLYTRTGNTWTQLGSKIVGTDNTGAAYQGYSLSLSADGSTAIMGGIQDNSNQGAAWVFVSNSFLPTKFIGITAIQKANDVIINFSTTNETQVHSYEVEESSNGINFKKGASIVAKNANINYYSCLATHIVMGNNYYRIKAIDNNGLINYSQIIKLKFGSTKVASISVYPNPIKNGVVQLQLSDIEQGEYTIRIINIVGKGEFTKVIHHLGGSSVQPINLKEVSKGTYVLQVFNHKMILTKKMVIK
jgi:hypothetical protein